LRKNKETGGTEIEEKRKRRWECNSEEQTTSEQGKVIEDKGKEKP
jgi:hypothetical protein